MKRQYFDISLNGSIVATTCAWNSAIRTIERLVRERSMSVAVESGKGAVYKLVDSHTEGPDKWHFTHGHRTWQCVFPLWSSLVMTNGKFDLKCTSEQAHETLRYDIKLRGSIPTC